MTYNSIKTKHIKFRIAVMNVRRHSGVHTFFQIIYIVHDVSVFEKGKPNQKYCLEIVKQIAALKFQKCVLS